jgi:hypothetical protein
MTFFLYLYVVVYLLMTFNRKLSENRKIAFEMTGLQLNDVRINLIAWVLDEPTLG